MKYISLIGLILMLFVSGCANQTNNQQSEQNSNEALENFPTEKLSSAELEALSLTLNDEYKAEAIYQKVLDKFGDVSPFNKIINAEQKHSDSLIQLYEKFNLNVPENDWYDKVPEYDSVQEACEAGVEAEIENIALYDELFLKVDNQDIIIVFTSLRDASKDKHLPAFQRCAK